MADKKFPPPAVKEHLLPTMKILITGGTAAAVLSLITHSTEEAMAARNISVHVHQCKTAKITPSNIQGYALIIALMPLRSEVGIPVINGAAFLSGVNYEQVWDAIADILGRTDLSPNP